VNETKRDLPAPVFVASLFGFAKAAFLVLLGIIGIFAWDDVTDPWGFGVLGVGILFGIASYALLRGKRVARIVLAVLSVGGALLALIFVFAGPPSVILQCIVAAALDVLVIWLLYGPRSSKEYFGS
jgi:hypothetical protein